MNSSQWYKGDQIANTKSLMAQSVPSSGSSLSLPGELKDLVSVKKLLTGEGDWTCVKEVLGWILDTEAGTVTLP